MAVPPQHHRATAGVRRPGLLAAGVLIAAMALPGCAPTEAPPSLVSPTVSVPTEAPLTQAPASPSPSVAVASTFEWAARPDGFAGDDGGSLARVAAGSAGFVALSVREQSDGARATRLWGSRD